MAEEKREHLRLPVASRIFIELVSPALGKQDSGTIVACETLDVSRRGLQVSMERDLNVGAILQIGVQLPDKEQPLYLAGEVEWCNANEEPAQSWSAGFRLMNADNSDIDAWMGILIEMGS